MAEEIKQFGSAVKEADKNVDAQPPIKVKIVERTISIHFPGTGQATYLAMAVADIDPEDIISIGRLINFVASMIDEDDRGYFRSCLLDTKVDFEAEHVMELAEYVVEQWSNRPTEKPSA